MKTQIVNLNIFLVFILNICSFTLCAESKFDIPYYEKNSFLVGDMKYRDEFCRIDLKIPDNTKKFPTLIWLHGGGLTRGKKSFLSVINSKKIAIVGVDYRLSSDKAKCPDYIYDSAAAIAWTIKNIEKFGGDPNKIYVTGHSAGGYLTAMVAMDDKYLKAFGCNPKDIKRYIPISGQMTTHFQILNERRKKNSKTPRICLDSYAPIFLASKTTPPLTLVLGDPDIDWPARVEENQLLAAILRRVFKRDVNCYSFKTFNHNTVLYPALHLINNMILSDQKQITKKDI